MVFLYGKYDDNESYRYYLFCVIVYNRSCTSLTLGGCNDYPKFYQVGETFCLTVKEFSNSYLHGIQFLWDEDQWMDSLYCCIQVYFWTGVYKYYRKKWHRFFTFIRFTDSWSIYLSVIQVTTLLPVKKLNKRCKRNYWIVIYKLLWNIPHKKITLSIDY